MGNEEDIELMESYLNGALGEEERSAFEARLESDEEFRVQFEEMSKLINGIRYAGSSGLKAHLKAFEATLPQITMEPEKTVPFWRNAEVLRVAASISIILVGVTVLLQLARGPEYKKLFDENFEIYPNQILPTKRGEYIPRTDKEKAYYAYDLGNYQEAYDLLTKIPQEEDGGAALFYAGMAALALDDLDVAINSFNIYIEQHTIFRDTAQWFLALTYLKSQKLEATKVTLKRVIELDNSYSRRARELLEKLE